MSIIFNQTVLHDRTRYIPGVVKYGFEDPDAEAYFKACGWASDADGSADVIIPKGECDIDPNTIHGTGENRGRKVLNAGANE